MLLPGPALLFAFVPAGLPILSPHLSKAQFSESPILVLKLSLKALGEQFLAATPGLLLSFFPFRPPPPAIFTSGQLFLFVSLSQHLPVDWGLTHSKLKKILG